MEKGNILKFLILLCYSYFLFAFELNGYYKICKRELNFFSSSKESSNFISYDNKKLEFFNLNPQHFHFMRINNQSTIDSYSQFWILFANRDLYKIVQSMPKNNKIIDETCIKNNFSNFGYYNNSKIMCNEHIQDFSKCSNATINGLELSIALNMLLTDFGNREYSIQNYNCQTFTRNLFAVINYIRKTPNAGPVCIKFTSNQWTVGNILKAIVEEDKIIKNNYINFISSEAFIDNIEWLDNPQYKK